MASHAPPISPGRTERSSSWLEATGGTPKAPLLAPARPKYERSNTQTIEDFVAQRKRRGTATNYGSGKASTPLSQPLLSPVHDDDAEEEEDAVSTTCCGLKKKNKRNQT